MTTALRRTRRLGLLTLLVCAAGATVGVANAAADATISGTATGKTIRLGNGSFRIVGTFVDPATPGVGGTYKGTYTELTSGYTSCNNKIFCAAFTCNLIAGQLTFSSAGKSVTLNFNSFLSPQFPSVCLDPVDPEVHDVNLWMNNYVGFCGSGISSRGYGPVYLSSGGMFGSSRHLAGGVYVDTSSLDISLTTCPT